jgi:glycosyltransferase involved in cell wall biosynthesis
MGRDEELCIGIIVIARNLDTDNACYSAIKNFLSIYGGKQRKFQIIGPGSTTLSGESISNKSIRYMDKPRLFGIINNISKQIQISHQVIKSRSELSDVFFHSGGTVMVLPLILCKLLNIDTYIFVTGSASSSYKSNYPSYNLIVPHLIELLEIITYFTTDKIIVFTNSKKQDIPKNFKGKTIVANLNYMDAIKKTNRPDFFDRDYSFIFVGRFIGVKNIMKLIIAFCSVVDTHPSSKLLLVGDGPLREDVEDLIQRNGLEENISITGWVSKQEVETYLSNSRYIVLPSESEGLPKSVLEAMSHGTVPVASPVGGLPSVIEDGTRGHLFQGTNPEEIASKLNFILKNNNWESQSHNCIDFIDREYSYEVVRAKYIDLLKH